MADTYNIYRDLGCSQEDHLPNCSHFGKSGLYLSEHAEDCPWGMKPRQYAACTCNPKARRAAQQPCLPASESEAEWKQWLGNQPEVTNILERLWRHERSVRDTITDLAGETVRFHEI